MAKKGNKASSVTRASNAAKRSSDLAPILEEASRNGASSYRQMAATLNELGISAPRGGRYMVSRPGAQGLRSPPFDLT